MKVSREAAAQAVRWGPPGEAKKKENATTNTKVTTKEGVDDTSASSAADAEEIVKKHTETCLVQVADWQVVDALTLQVYIRHRELLLVSTCTAC